MRPRRPLCFGPPGLAIDVQPSRGEVPVSRQKTVSFRRFSGALMAGLLALSVTAVQAMSDDDGEKEGKKAGSPMSEARQLVRDRNWGGAIGKLEEALEGDQYNADVLNLLGFSHRNLGQFDEALEYYRRALKVDPEHLGANEYLGELYLQRNDLTQALAQLEILDSACFLPCKEYNKLKESVDRYKAKNGVN